MTQHTWKEVRFWTVVAVLVISAAWLSHRYSGAIGKPNIPDLANIPTEPASWDGNYPCLSAKVGEGSEPKLTTCSTPGANAPAIDELVADFPYWRFVLRQTDLSIDDDIPVVLTRTYTSVEWAHRNHEHAFGFSSSHRYDIAPVGSVNPFTYLFIGFEDGQVLFFPRITPGTSYEDAAYRQTESSGPWYGAEIQWEGQGYRLTRKDGLVMRFPDSSNATNAAQGAPFEILDSSGHRLVLRRNKDRDLEQIRTEHGHYIQFQYDNQHHITRAETDSGQWREYKYNSDRMLTDVVAPEGLLRHYVYEGQLMTQVQDEHNKVLVRNSYENGYLVAQQFAEGKVYRYAYRFNMDPQRVVITMPNGETRTVDCSAAFTPARQYAPR